MKHGELEARPRPSEDAEKLGEEAHALTATAIKGEKATPEQHHEAARAHAAAAEAWAKAGNQTKAKEHEDYATHHKGQIVQVPPPEPGAGKPGVAGAKGAKPKAKSFNEVMVEKFIPVTKAFTFTESKDHVLRNVARHRSGRFHPLGKITASQYNKEET